MHISTKKKKKDGSNPRTAFKILLPPPSMLHVITSHVDHFHNTSHVIMPRVTIFTSRHM
jgi:hypothetical protein